MVAAILAFVAATAPAVPCGAPVPARAAPMPAPARSDSLEALYRGGVTFDDFLATAQARRQLWHENWNRAEVPPDLLEKARSVQGSWRLLAVSVDGCSDSVSTIPFIARLVAQVDGLDMRIIDNVVGRPLMEAHRTPDGRPATPTLVLLDGNGAEAGCWVERPATLQTWYLENQSVLGTRDLVAQKMEWYHADAGATTLREVLGMIEAASRGERVCAALPDSG